MPVVNVPVAIVGGGPVGLTLALELSRAQVPCLLMTENVDTSSHPKCNTVGARSMEHFRRLGVAEVLRRSGLPADYPTDVVYTTRFAGAELARLQMPASSRVAESSRKNGLLDLTPEPAHRISQIFLERLLKDQAESRSSIALYFGHRFEGSQETDHGITVRMTDPRTGSIQVVQAQWLVGCDGAGSTVRKSLGIPFAGESSVARRFFGGTMISTYFRSRALFERLSRDPGWMYWTMSPALRTVMVRIDGNGRFLLHYQIPEGIDAADIDRSALIRGAAGFDIDVEILSTQSWTAGRSLVAERYRAGRAFIAGDAAHLLTPTGGFGMNTGIDDVSNLAWKLAAAHHNWGGAALLDSYETERMPIAHRNIAASRKIADAVGNLDVPADLELDDERGEAHRRALGERLSRIAAEEFLTIGVQLGACYSRSPVIVAEEGAERPDSPTRFVPTSVPGARAPHFWKSAGHSVFDDLACGFALLIRPGAAPRDVFALNAAAAMRGVPLKTLEIPEPAAADLYERTLTLVRPDQYVCWRGDSATNPGGIIDRVIGAH